MNRRPRIAIIGAGPIGLEAALYARLRGYEVTIYERGRIAENVRRWGHVQMFSPFGMNSSEWGRRCLSTAGDDVPGLDEMLSGKEFANRYLAKFRSQPEMANAIRECCAVASIGRPFHRKSHLIAAQERAQGGFRLLIHDLTQSSDSIAAADVVLDCSGSFGIHNWLGSGGHPCPGEAALADEIEYGIPDVLGVHAEAYVGRRVLVVGAGHSAATTVLNLVRLNGEAPKTHVVWVSQRVAPEPMRLVENDSLVDRDALNRAVNDCAKQSPAVSWFGGHVVREIRPEPHADSLSVTLESVEGGRSCCETVDRIVANVGYRPDRSLYEELQVHECYATQGPMKLAAKLLGETSADCLDQSSHGPAVLRNPEPNFYILGMKSYGRNSNFLIQVGLQQIVDVFTLIEQDWG